MRRKIGTLIVFSYLCKTMQEKDKNTSNSAWVSRLMNKYTITLLIFLVWLAFFDRNSLVGKMQLRGKIATLKKEKFGKAKGIVMGGFLAGFLIVLVLIIRRIVKQLA